ncbi:RNA polymerase sigma-70 factor [Pedobacter frigoris]|uniref:RNA polymerase sigma factor n=1 Tax=Pedobacter frigoris TaxID=2571272 RepID=UPI00292E90B5|nr:RNA polymerase sigma-70 factor [Pedobacter frigoris]
MDSYKELLDAQLIRLLKQGDKVAFAEIYDRYAIMVYYKVNQMLKDEEASKDLIQDLFTSIWDKADHIREEANFAGYLYIASRNRVLKLIQKHKTKNDYLTELGKYSSDISYETVHKLDEREMMLIILNEITKLPPKMREVFQLSRLENLSHKEIAAKLNISEATVRKQVQNSLGILKTTLGKYSPLGVLFLALFKE